MHNYCFKSLGYDVYKKIHLVNNSLSNLLKNHMINIIYKTINAYNIK